MKEFFKKILIYILKIESKLVLFKYKPKIIAITGTVGKTSTKDAIFSVLSGFSYVRKSEKSYNSQIGLPLTILGCPNGWSNPVVWIQNIFKSLWLIIWPHKYPKWLILEVGVGKPGDMNETASWLKTDIVVITAIGETPVHIEFFESKKHLIEEKSELINTLRNTGVLVLNYDDEVVREMKSKTKCRVLTYGYSEGADFRASEYNVFYGENDEPKGLVYRIDEGGKSLPVSMEGILGENYVYAGLGALAVASALKVETLESIERLKTYQAPPGRMNLLRGVNESFIIDDTYNSSPLASKAALHTLQMINNTGRKIAVLGDMLELGKHTEDAHRDIGKFTAGSADILVAVGPRSEKIVEGALKARMGKRSVKHFLNSDEAKFFVKELLQKGDLVLVKGSQGIRMEKIVEEILRDKEKDKSKLVRQEKEWNYR